MAYQVASNCDFCGLPWSEYVCCEGWQSSQPKDNNIETDLSQYYYPYSESFASSSSFPDLSLSRSTELTSTSSSTSEVDFADFTKQKTGDFRAMDPSTIRSGLMAAETTKHSDVNGYIDPRLVVSDLPSCNNPNTSDRMENATPGGSLVQRLYNDFRPPLVDQVSSLQYPTNDFDIALSEVQPTIHAFKPSLDLWLQTWVATNPQKFPNNQELESLRTLSGLSEAEIVSSLSKHVSTQVTSAAEAMDTEPTIRDVEQTSYQKRPPRYRPKCRRSRRRFRYVAETQHETRIFECTHRCGQSFARKGQWTRHERSNIEEWKCHRCDFVSARKDKLRSHLKGAHSLRGGAGKSHCRQLLQPSARRCGFCLKQFENWDAWLSHISAHFEGHIAGGPWTMARWNRAVDPDFGSGESEDDDDDDNDDDDDDQAGNEEDQDDPDYDNSATDQTGNSSSKGKDASYGSGSEGSSRSSSKPKSKSSGSRSSKSHGGASRALSYLQQDYYTSQSSHTMSPLKLRKADLVPLDGEGNRGFLRYRKPDRLVVQNPQTCSPKDSNGVEMESVSGIFAPRERERRQDQPLRLGAVKSNIGYGGAMSGVSALPEVLMMQQSNAVPPGATLPHAALHRDNPMVTVMGATGAGKSTLIGEKTKDPDRHGRNSCNSGPDLHGYGHKESQKTLGTLCIDHPKGFYGDHERSRKIDRTTSVEMAHDPRRRRVEFFLPAKGGHAFGSLKCSDKTCDKTFNRRYDLAKHEKTHSHPFKCPTEKEWERCVNGKHAANPKYYGCAYCPFKTKRDSHWQKYMEKKHDWHVRTPPQMPQTPSMAYLRSAEILPPSKLGWGGSSTSGGVAGSAMMTPLDQPMHDFNAYSPASTAPFALIPREQPMQPFDQFNFGPINRYLQQPQTLLHGYGYQQTPITPTFITSPITPAQSGAYSFGQSPHNSYNIDINLGAPSTYNSGLPIPGPRYLQPTSRNPSISYNSPLAHELMEDFLAAPPSAAHDMRGNNLNTFKNDRDMWLRDRIPLQAAASVYRAEIRRAFLDWGEDASGHSIPSASSSTVGSPYSGHAHSFSHHESWVNSNEGLGLGSALVNQEAYYQDFVGTPLLWAAGNGYEAIVKPLLAMDGVDPDSKDNSGRTPLLWAVKGGDEVVFRSSLTNESVDLNSKDNDGRTPLSRAAEKGNEAQRERWPKLQRQQRPARPANFHTIQTLYGAKDRRHLTQFKIDRFLNELGNDYPWGSILECSWESEAAEDSIELSTGEGSTDLIQDNRPPSDEDALHVQHSSSLRRYGISRSGRKKNSDHDTGTIPSSQQGCETH